MTDIETVQALEKELQQKITGLKSKTQHTGAVVWLDLTNGEKGMTITCYKNKFGLSVLPGEDDDDVKVSTDKNLLVAEVFDYLK